MKADANEYDSSIAFPAKGGNVMAWSVTAQKWCRVTKKWVCNRPDIYTKWRPIETQASDAGESNG